MFKIWEPLSLIIRSQINAKNSSNCILKHFLKFSKNILFTLGDKKLFARTSFVHRIFRNFKKIYQLNQFHVRNFFTPTLPFVLQKISEIYVGNLQFFKISQSYFKKLLKFMSAPRGFSLQNTSFTY